MVVAVQQLLLLVVVWLAGLTDGGPGETEGLLEWIRELGGGVEGVGFQSIPGMGMGVVSTRNLEAGTVVSRTPLTALISLEHALVSEVFATLSEELPQLSNLNLKALFLAHERERGRRREEGEGEGGETVEGALRRGESVGNVSFWQPYLDSLPSVLHTTLFFTEEDLEHLQTSMVREFAEKQQSSASKAYGMIGELTESRFPELKHLSLDDLKWGVSIWSSRAHSVRVRDTSGEWQIASCLVPVADMFNMAAREQDVSVRCDTNDDSTHFECHTTKALPSGKQLLAEYISQPDKRLNGRLLLHYGFILPGNPHDSVSIKLPEISHDLPHFKERQELSRKLQILKKPFLQLTHPSAPNPTISELLKVMRLIQGSIPELQRAAKLSSPFSLPLSSSSEHRVLRKTHDYLRNIISSYHTTVEQDIHTLHSSDSLSHNSWLAVVLRSEEKRLLTANLAHLLSVLSQDTNRQHTRRKNEL